MRVLYVSKALTLAAYRDKLRALQAHVDVTAVIPRRWGSVAPEPDQPELLGGPVEGADRGPGSLAPGRRTPPASPRRDRPRVWFRRALLAGHNHLHVYPGARRLLAESSPHLVHIDEEPYSLVTLQLARLCHRAGVPSVFFAWQNLEKRLPAPFERLRSQVFRRVAGGIAGTDGAAAVLRAWGYEGPLAVIPQFGVDPRRFAPDPEARARGRAALRAAPKDFVVAFGGRLVPEKGVRLLLRAVARMDGVRLVLLGEGPERPALERDARRAGALDRIRFLGRVPSWAVPYWLAAADAVVLPSLSRPNWAEQFGRILVEAMACSVPVVGSDSGEIPEVVGDSGIVVPEGDLEALRGALEALEGSPERRAELGARGRARALERFSQERVARDTVAFYRTLTGPARDTRSWGTAPGRTEAAGPIPTGGAPGTAEP